MSRHFDRIVIVDWSARSIPSPTRESADAIWIGAAGAGELEPRYMRTRTEALAWLGDFLARERAAGRRVLAGFDFPFGYPRGLAQALSGTDDAIAVWNYLAERVRDTADNGNNRFAVAAAINALLAPAGPFWGRPASVDAPGVPVKKPVRDPAGLPEHRLVESIAKGAKSCWQLAYAGAVGSQVLMGLPALLRLRRESRLADATRIWPFETGLALPDAQIVLAEIYPSLLADAIRAAQQEDEPLDRAQVRVVAAAYAALDAAGELAPLFAPDLPLADRRIVAREEGWILGVGHEAALRDAARAPVPPLRNDCFAMPPGVDWVPVDEALARLSAGLAPVTETETLPLAAAGGRILAEPIAARRAHPAGANSAVDGYGFAHASLGAGPHVLPLAEGRAAAGAPFAGAVPPGRAIRILTGALLPEGVDTVILEEDVLRQDAEIRFARGLGLGANTRARGEDVDRGAEILPAGHRLRPQDLALAAATGVGRLAVRRRLRVAVLSTGDEVLSPGATAEAHQVHDANRPMLLEMLRRWDLDAIDLGHARDDPDAVAAALDRGAGPADAILTSGGASAGDEDHVAALLRRRGSLETWRIAMKPGRPLALGLWAGRPVFGLPGNPVAAFVCTLVFARPALMRLAGAPWQRPRGLIVPAAFEKDKKAGRVEYLRARLTSDGAAEVFRSEGSGRVSGLVWAQGLVELGADARRIRPGDAVSYLPFAEFGL